jgi:uncharacterized protein (DUF2062 family)
MRLPKFYGKLQESVTTADNLMMMSKITELIKRHAALWLRQGASPRRLALTLALGFAIGCIPVIGIPTLVCAALAMALRLNLPAIQAANYAAMPFQLLLIVPFVRLGGWLFASGSRPAANTAALLHSSPWILFSQMGSLAGHALVAWLLIAVPTVLLMTAPLALLLRRVPALVATESGD